MVQLSVFWGALLLPGLVVVRLRARRELDGGVLSAVAIGYLASFALLAPVLLVSYLVELPVAITSGAIVCFVAAAVAVIVRLRAWHDLRGAIRWEAAAGLAVVVVHLVLAAREGTWLQGDTTFHVARVRFLLDHGVSNRGIYLQGDGFARAYSMNMLHGVLASAAQLTGLSPLEVWRGSAAWARLVTIAGHGALAYAVFGSRWAAWIAAALAATALAGVPYALYPNSLATWWLVPTLLGMGIGAARRERESIAEGLLFALGVVVLSQVHPLYALFLAACLAPFLVWRAAVAKRPWSFPVRRLLALLVLVPYVLVVRGGSPTPEPTRDHTTWQKAVADDQAQWLERNRADDRAERIAEAGGGPMEKTLSRTEAGAWVLPLKANGGVAFFLAGVAALAWSALRRHASRVELAGLGLALAVPAATLYVPVLCSLAVALSAPFLVVRLAPIVNLCLFVALAGTVRPEGSTLRARALGTALVLVAATAGTQLPGHAPNTWSDHIRAALKPAEERSRKLRRLEARAALLSKAIPTGVTVLASLQLARHVVMLHDCFVIAPDRGPTGSANILERRYDVVRLTDPTTPWPLRRELLDAYGVRYVVFSAGERARFAWTLAKGKRVGRRGGWTVVDLGAVDAG